MRRILILAADLVSIALLGGCGPQYSPDTYSTAAVQQANKVDRGVLIGVRKVAVSAPGVVGAASGAAVGGAAGSQAPGGTVGSAFGAVGGALLGGLVGTGVEHVAADTAAFEYIVRKPNGELVSVTQKDAAPLAVGTKVLVIAGSQARIVPDYTVTGETAPGNTAPAGDAPAGSTDAPALAPAPAPLSSAQNGTAAPPTPPVAETPLPAPSTTANPLP